jgi:hypothetical protein
LPATEAAAWFAQQSPPVTLDRTTVVRQAKKHDAPGGTLWQKIGRANQINVTALLPIYASDYGRALHAGELSAPDAPNLALHADPAPETPRRPPTSARNLVETRAPAGQSGDPDADQYKNDPLKRKAHEQARKAQRENDEAEGHLVPAASLHAAAASAIAETVSTLRRQNHRTAEEISAKVKRAELAGEIRAILEAGQAAAFNALSDVFAREMQCETGDARARFERLEAIAHDMLTETAVIAA